MKTNFLQAPSRNASVIGVSVYSHSGEFAPSYTDLHLPGRGLALEFVRAYRSSLAGRIGEMGRGWSSNIIKKVESRGRSIIYHNGAGETHEFARDRKQTYKSPAGFYGCLAKVEQQYLIHQRFGIKLTFESPERGGRILTIEDKNTNVIGFSYSSNTITILDTLRRRITIGLSNGLIEELKDHSGRKWGYVYDKDSHLVEVIQPATQDFPNGTSVKYAYDGSHRLSSITDAKGQQYLVNSYDASGRVVAQKHGAGQLKMGYEVIGRVTRGYSAYRTKCIGKNGSTLLLTHNPQGNVVTKTLYVRKESFLPDAQAGIKGKTVPLITKSAYNGHAELISRTFPAGNKTQWVYSDNEKNPINQGNLRIVTNFPFSGVKSDQAQLVTKYEYDQRFQLVKKVIDPRGNTTSYEYDEKGNLVLKILPSVTIHPVSDATPKPTPLKKTQQVTYQYNSKGQLLRENHIDGSVTEYHYYLESDPTGTHGPNGTTNQSDEVCGYLARIIRDANGRKLQNQYAYDIFGNITTVWDGKGNSAQQQYNPMGKVIRIIGREPFRYKIEFKYDANYNQIESTQSFERLEYDEPTHQTSVRSSIRRELREYDALDNLTRRHLVADNTVVTELFIRDAADNIIRQVQPLGNTTEYVYDERNLLIEKRFGVGAREAFSEYLTYTLNGAISTHTDGNCNTTTHHYDGFHRYKGFTTPNGTNKTLWRDEVNNVVRIEINGRAGVSTKGLKDRRRPSIQLVQTQYHFDEWNRAYRVDRAWHDASNGNKLGNSKWDNMEGIVSTVLEYGENGLPRSVWTEANNVMDVEYDGCGRVVRMKELTGNELSFEYDANNNPTLIRSLGPDVEGRRFEQILRRRYDEMDRLVWQQLSDEASVRVAYNALGNVIGLTRNSGAEIGYLHDSLGRHIGHVCPISDSLASTKTEQIVRHVEYDDNFRPSSYTDAAGNRTVYRYDALDRQIGIVFPDGTAETTEYDANGNIVRAVDPNRNEILNRYDAANRLIERRSHIVKTTRESLEHFEYDGLNRMIAAHAPNGSIRRTYDSLSRILTEHQGKRKLVYERDSAGNLTRLVYPGGEELRKTYDNNNRVTSVRNKAGEEIVNIKYRANDRIAQMVLGTVLEGKFSYNLQERLESIEYYRTDDHKLIEGFRYQYDDSGKMTHEIQLTEGSASGERYHYDSANRAMRAQYGVQNVFDPNSAFDYETLYEHFPEGSWKRRTDVDGRGRIIEQRMGKVDHLNSYTQFGDLFFEYDANGNCLRKGKANPGFCLYTYDEANRLIKSECYSVQGANIQLIETIEYFYDSLGRQVRKVVTHSNGSVTEYTYVWSGKILLEEYENGVLARTYVYSIGALPVQLSVTKGGRLDYLYTHNGRGLASGLVSKRDPNAFAEKYGYELTGASFMKEIKGVPVKLPSRHTTVSALVNSILSGTYLRDWHWPGGSHSSLGGRHTNPEIAAALNSAAAFGGHKGAEGVLAEQIRALMGTLGSGGQNFVPIAPETGFSPPMASRWSLIAAGGYGNVGPRPGSPGRDIGGETYEKVTEPAAKFFAGLAIGLALPEVFTITVVGEGTAGVIINFVANEAVKHEALDPLVEFIFSIFGIGDDEDEDEDEEAGDDYVNPDADTNAQIQLPTPQQVEAKLNQTRRPVNPNDGILSNEKDYSHPVRPLNHDPIALYNPDEVGGGGGVIDTPPLIGGGYTDFVRGRDPVTPPPGSKPGGETTPNNGRALP